MAQSPAGRALIQIANEHSGNTVLNLVFGREVAGDRASRFAFIMASRAMPQDVVIDIFVSRSYWRPGGSAQYPYRIPTGAITFAVHSTSLVHAGDVIHVEAYDHRHANTRLCILDVRVTCPTRIIPATILVPYVESSIRLNRELDRTDMLPMWFWNGDGTLGVPITSGSFDSQSNTATRVEVASLKVALWWRGYDCIEKQIQLRSNPSLGQPRTNVTFRRLASLVSGAVRNAMSTYERTSAGRAEWNGRRWRIGAGPGQISASDVMLLGIVFVSHGRVMPLLQVRPDFVFAA
ncbi:hypothetical protein PENSPDRAFT_100091 [Peniophora sp. CONT]|nr:hypothetical protein PENSPDRAFT_100091 [Peniophora sp. CONT]